MWTFSLGRQWKQGDEALGERAVAGDRQRTVRLERGERDAAIDRGGDRAWRPGEDGGGRGGIAARNIDRSRAGVSVMRSTGPSGGR